MVALIAPVLAAGRVLDSLGRPLRFASLPHALRVRLPRSAPAVTRPRFRAALTRRDLTALLHVAAGRPVPAAAG